MAGKICFRIARFVGLWYPKETLRVRQQGLKNLAAEHTALARHVTAHGAVILGQISQ